MLVIIVMPARVINSIGSPQTARDLTPYLPYLPCSQRAHLCMSCHAGKPLSHKMCRQSAIGHPMMVERSKLWAHIT